MLTSDEYDQEGIDFTKKELDRLKDYILLHPEPLVLLNKIKKRENLQELVRFVNNKKIRYGVGRI